jgi:hypothetical protein
VPSWTWGHLVANVGTSKHAGGDRVSTISLLGCSTSVALAMGPTDSKKNGYGWYTFAVLYTDIHPAHVHQCTNTNYRTHLLPAQHFTVSNTPIQNHPKILFYLTQAVLITQHAHIIRICTFLCAFISSPISDNRYHCRSGT